MSTRRLRPQAMKITDVLKKSKPGAGQPNLKAPNIEGTEKKITWRKLPEFQVVVHRRKPFSSPPPLENRAESPVSSELSEFSEQSSSDFSPPPKKRVKKVVEKKAKVTRKSVPKGKEKPSKKKDKLKYPPGVTPYPELIHPTPEECYKVTALLTAAHGPAVRPETVPEPDNDVSGCGEVPSVLDALVRTVLSANTTNLNSSRAFQGLIERFGLVTGEPNVVLDGGEAVKDEDGKQAIKMAKKIGEGSVDWDNVRKATIEDLEEAIKSGGLANMKSRHIKGILDDVYKQSQERIKTKLEAEGIKVDEEDIQGDISMEYLKDVGDDEIMQKLVSFNGVGCKTAACVAMFCLGRPKFPVDTHVWRISRFLSWVPNDASREEAYHHLDTRIPNELKYALHNLLIRHGRTCAHCKAGPERAAKSPPKTAKKTTKKTAKRPRDEDEGGEVNGDYTIKKERKMRTKKVWIGTGMMKEVVVEIPDDGIEGQDEKELESCVLEELVNRIRKLPKERNS